MTRENIQSTNPGSENSVVMNDKEIAAYWLSALIDSAEDAIISKTLEGIITSWNKGAERIFGYTAEETIGKSILILIPPALHSEEQVILGKIRAGERVEHYETIRRRKDGTLIDISLTVSPIKTPEGKIIGASKIARDISGLKRAEEKLRESEKQLRLITNSVPALIAYIDSDQRYRFANKAYSEWFGISPENLIGKTVREFIGDAAYEKIVGRIERVLSGEEVTYEQLMPYASGEKYIHVGYTPDFDEVTGKVKGFFALIQDVTESKKAEARLRESEARFSKAFSASPLVLTISSLKTGKLLEVNDTFVNVTGFSREEAIGKTTLELGLWAKPQEREAEMETVRQVGQVRNAEYLFTVKNGVQLYGLLSAEKIEIAGEPYALTVIQDITERKRAEMEQERIYERFRLAEEASKGFIYECFFKTNLAERTERVKEILGYTPEEIGSHFEAWYELIHPDDLPGAMEKLQQKLISGENRYENEYRVRHKDGHWVHLEDRGLIRRDEDGTPDRIVGFLVDISARKREELDRQFLLEFGEKIRFGEFDPEKFLDEVAKTTCLHLEAARCLFIEINEAEDRGIIKHQFHKPDAMPVPAEYKISDYSPQTLEEIKSGRTIVNYNAERDPRTADIYQTVYEPYDERSYVSIPLFTNGEWTAIFWISDDKPRCWTAQEIAFLETVGERAWLAIEKMRKDEALRQSRERLQMAMDAAQIYSWEMNLATQEIEWSKNLEHVLGFPLPTEFKTTVNDLVHPDDREKTEQLIIEAIQSGKPYSSEFRLVNPYNGEIVWVRGQGILVQDKKFNQSRFVGITQNITARKQAEQERERLLQSEKAARHEAEEASRLKDEFLATVSHELRTPLNAILGWSQMLASGNFDSADVQRALETIYRNAKSQAQLIEDILDVSRIITGKLRIEPRPVPLAPVIQSAADTLRPAIEAKNIRLRMYLDFEPQMVHVDPDRLQQVVWNLLSNAIKFSPEGGQVTIALESDKTQTKIIVSDTGKGISTEFLPYVFERFRQADGSSTRKYGGLGLGLAIVRHIVELHGGRIEVNSPGENLGTTFTVFLPLSDSPASGVKLSKENPPEEQSNGSTRGNVKGLRVLLVDDEKDTLEILKTVLNRHGADVRAQLSVKEALETIKDWKPDVIVSDIAMPDEDGYSLIKKLRALPLEQGGAIPAIALTAYVGVKERTQVLSRGFQMYLSKPFEPVQLVQVLSDFVKAKLEI